MFEMTMSDFENKLQDIFTDEQIERLNKYGYESAKDVNDNINDSELYDIGRWHVCEWLTYADIEEIREIISDFSNEQSEWLCDQIQEEW